MPTTIDSRGVVPPHATASPPTAKPAQRAPSPMGVTAGVTSRAEYVDAESKITNLRVPADEVRVVSPLAHDRVFLVLQGHGNVRIEEGDSKGINVAEQSQISLRSGATMTVEASYGQPLQLKCIQLRKARGEIESRVMPPPTMAPFRDEYIIVSDDSFRKPGVASIAPVIVPPRVSTSAHRLRVNERYIMTRGAGVMHLDERALPVKTGDVVAIPAGTKQYVANTNLKESMELYCLCTPQFTPDAYIPAQPSAKHPPEFDLDTWWEAQGSTKATSR